MELLEQAREYFSKDYYATQTTGIQIDDVTEKWVKCSLRTNLGHYNANGYIMGGVLFTMADFAFAVVANLNKKITVSQCSQINFLAPTKADMLYAEANLVKEGRTICYCEIIITDSDNKLIAKANVNGFRR